MEKEIEAIVSEKNSGPHHFELEKQWSAYPGCSINFKQNNSRRSTSKYTSKAQKQTINLECSK
jgi:hypothetical protein